MNSSVEKVTELLAQPTASDSTKRLKSEAKSGNSPAGTQLKGWKPPLDASNIYK